MPDRVRFFDSYQTFLDSIENIVAVHKHQSNDYSSWAGGTKSETIHKAKFGDNELLERANKIVLDIENILLPSVETYQEVSYYYGHRPNISAVIAGQPKSMYRREYVLEPSNTKPIKIYLDRVTSVYFSADQILARGLAVMALALALKRLRPTVLYVGESACNRHTGNNTCSAISIDLNNIDLSVLAFALAGPSFYRRLLFAINSHLNDGANYNSYKVSAETTRRMLGFSEHDLIFEGMWFNDADIDLSIENPTQWVRQRLEAMSNVGAAE